MLRERLGILRRPLVQVILATMKKAAACTFATNQLEGSGKANLAPPFLVEKSTDLSICAQILIVSLDFT